MRVPSRQLREATCWLVISAINDHSMRCEAARFPNENPTCMEKCCPRCCGTCSTLRWFRDTANDYLTRMLNDFSPGASWSWQMADGSVDWSQVEAHWDDSGSGCGSGGCLQAATTAGLGPFADEGLAGGVGV